MLFRSLSSLDEDEAGRGCGRIGVRLGLLEGESAGQGDAGASFVTAIEAGDRDLCGGGISVGKKNKTRPNYIAGDIAKRDYAGLGTELNGDTTDKPRERGCAYAAAAGEGDGTGERELAGGVGSC